MWETTSISRKLRDNTRSINKFDSPVRGDFFGELEFVQVIPKIRVCFVCATVSGFRFLIKEPIIWFDLPDLTEMASNTTDCFFQQGPIGDHPAMETLLVGKERSLKYLLEQRITTYSQQHWIAKLMGYDFEIMYKTGSSNKERRRRFGGSIIDVGASWHRFSFCLSKRSTRATQTPNLFKLQGTLSFRSANTFSDGSYYMGQRRYRKGYVSFKLEGFWHEPSGKVCMVGISSVYSRKGDFLNVNVVFKLNDVFNESNITTLVTGSLENLSSEKGDDSYFEPISVLMLPNGKYNYNMDSEEVVIEFRFIEFLRLQLEYSLECHASKNCSISGSSDKLPSLMSLTTIGCSLTTKKHRLRVLVEFQDIDYYVINQSFDPKTMLVGEGWWDEKNNTLCVVACHIMRKSSSLVGTHVGDCSVRLRLRFPSILSIRNTSGIVGQIWSNKSGSDSGYFKMVTFRNDEGRGVGVHGLKYEFSHLETVNKLCPRPTQKPNEKRKRYPEAYSYSMRFDMSVKESMKRVGWGYSEPIAIDDEISDFPDEVPDETIDINNGSLFNMSYRIGLSVLYPTKSVNNNSVFNLSSESVKIIAEGVYDAGAGTLCMVGCRELNPISKNETPVAHSTDCDILLKIQFPPLDSSDRSYIKGSIESRRKESDPLYFKHLDISAVPYYTGKQQEEKFGEWIWK
ncbi:hypothetical protein V8G54_026564 [Vigna mungo]|uniref:DUF2921 domain-containing protein n=1 Tax=Vigna mungo TaxID=3915 RepID=A0AAQ3MYZ5_VIGMU